MSVVHFKTQTEFDASRSAFMAQHGKRFPFISAVGQLPLFANGGADLCADVLKWLRKRRIKYAHHHGFVVFTKESDAICFQKEFGEDLFLWAPDPRTGRALTPWFVFESV